MKFKQIILPIVVTLLTIVLLYMIGAQFKINILRWNYKEVTPDGGGFMVEYGGSIIPIIIGIIAGFITERVMIRKQIA